MFLGAGISLPQDSAALLERIRAHAIEQLVRQPAYTCLETVTRRHETAAGELLVEDTIRVEVAIVDGKEMYSWPGSPEFDSAEATELVRSGTFASGNFGLYPRLVFYGNEAQFTPGGDQQLGGRRTMRFEFKVPRELSGFHMQTAAGDMVLGFHGYFLADPATLDLAALQIVADDLTEASGIQHAQDYVEYKRVEFTGESFLLPARAVTRVGDGSVINENRVAFSQCRKFAGESVLLDEPPEESAVTETTETREIELPSGIEFQVALLSIDLSQAAVGDVIEAPLRSDLKSGKQVIVPKGAIARGRIVRLDRFPSQTELRVKINEIAWPGTQARLREPVLGDLVIPGKNVRKSNNTALTLKP